MFASLTLFADRLARLVALCGGAALLAVVVMTCVSIAGRALVPVGLGPIPGDYELIEIGVAFAIFCFLPWCHLARGHATVDLFRDAIPAALNRTVDLLIDILMLAVAVLIAWRLYLGMLDKRQYAETTFILQFPIWIAYAAALFGAFAFVAICLFCVLRSARELTGYGAERSPS